MRTRGKQLTKVGWYASEWIHRLVLFEAEFLAYSETFIGIIVDFLNVIDARNEGVYVPTRAAAFSSSPTVLWPVIEFAPSKYANERISNKTLIPQMAVDVMNAM
jgi:hypothetical protein